jgi:hypothetical protein
VSIRADSPRPEIPRLHHVVVVPSRGTRVVVTERSAPPAPAPAAAVAA